MPARASSVWQIGNKQWNWLGVAADDSSLILRDTAREKIYALGMDWP
jgi:hypothetical protein